MHDIDWDLLHRYLSGECTADERALFETWRDASPERQELVRALLRETAEPAAVPLLTKRDQAETWARLERTIAGTHRAAPPARRFVVARGRRPLHPTVAAAALVALAVGVGAVRGRVWRAFGSTPAHGAPPAEHTLQTPRGQRATFQLPDGTRVVLGPASTLRYTTEFGRRLRDVRLQGEGYFTVVHDERRPFRVAAAGLLAQDLGTEFTVRAYPDDAHAVVAVRSGEVGIRADSAIDATVRVVAAGELGQLSAHGDPIVVAADLDRYFSWAEGTLVFDAVPLREVLPDLRRWFDLDLRLADSALGAIPVSAALNRPPTPDVVDNMAAGLGLVAAREGGAVYFRRPVSSR